MKEKNRLFCTQCNPTCFYQPDRRAAESEASARVLPFTGVDRRVQADDRRGGHDRRNTEEHALAVSDKRASKGRRPFDGHAWFEGCLEDALEAAWFVGDVSAFAAPSPEGVLCPQCHKKMASRGV